MKIDRPGIYKVTREQYLADPVCQPSLTSSIIKQMVNLGGTPLHVWNDTPRLNPNFEPDDEQKFDLGAAAHSLMLNDPQAFAIVNAKDWRTKDAQNARDTARAHGKIPLLAEQWERTLQMVQAGRRQLTAHAECFDAFVDGVSESMIVWREGDVWCRGLLDWRRDGYDLFPDYKTTAAKADPDAWQRTAYQIGADIQAAFYTRGIRALGLSDRPRFRFVVQENFKPFALAVVALTPGALELADREVMKGIDRWAECLRTNRWPGYPTRTCWIDAPAWHEAAILDREVRSHDAEKLDEARKAQAPL